MIYAVNEVIEMAGVLAQGEFDRQFQQDFPVTTKASNPADRNTKCETNSNDQTVQGNVPNGLVADNSFWIFLVRFLWDFDIRISDLPLAICFVPRRRFSVLNFGF